MKNVAGKGRKLGNPYAQWTDPVTGWEYQLLKSYQADNSRDNYTRWFMGVKSPATYGTFELGDGYVREYRGSILRALNARSIDVDESIWEADEYGYSGAFAAWVWGEQ